MPGVSLRCADCACVMRGLYCAVLWLYCGCDVFYCIMTVLRFAELYWGCAILCYVAAVGHFVSFSFILPSSETSQNCTCVYKQGGFGGNKNVPRGIQEFKIGACIIAFNDICRCHEQDRKGPGDTDGQLVHIDAVRWAVLLYLQQELDGMSVVTCGE